MDNVDQRNHQSSSTRDQLQLNVRRSDLKSWTSGYSSTASSMCSSHASSLVSNKRSQALANLQSMCDRVLQSPNSKFDAITFCQLFSQTETHTVLFQLFDDTSKGEIVQSTLLDFLAGKLGPEGKSFVDLFDTLAYVIAGEADLNSHLFSRIFRTEKLLRKLFKLVDTEKCGTVTVDRVIVFIMDLTLIKYWRPKSVISLQSIDDIFSSRTANCGKESELSLEEFKKCITCKDVFFAERVFRVLDSDNSNGISSSELRGGLERLFNQTATEKVRFLFQIYDRDGDGLIQLGDVKNILKACTQENQMSFSDEQMDQLAQALFEDALNSVNTNSSIKGLEYQHIQAQLDKHPGLVDELSFSLDRFLLPNSERFRKKKHRSFNNVERYFRKNKPYVFLICGYILVNVALATSRIIQYRDNSKTYMLAKTFGQILNFNCALVAVFMLRKCITWLRRIGWARVLPLDAHVELHKVCGLIIPIFGILHGMMHVLNFGLNVANQVPSPVTNQTYTLSEWLFTMRPGVYGLIPGISNLTGWTLLVILAIMIPCSLPCIRKSGYFELFYWTHLLYVPFWILLILHCSHFWYWFVFPGTLLFGVEFLTRLTRRQTGQGKTNIINAVLLPSGVTHLVIRKPPNFHFHPGDYVYVNIPKIASFEWHPFTISSAPELPDVLWLHIRACGGWTNKLYEYFKQEQIKMDDSMRAGSFLQSTSHSVTIDIPIQTTLARNTNNAQGDAFSYFQRKQRIQGEAKASESPTRPAHPVTQEGYRYMRQPPKVINLAIPSNKMNDKHGQLLPEGQSLSRTPREAYAPETLRIKNGTKSINTTSHFATQANRNRNADDDDSSRTRTKIEEGHPIHLPLEITVDGPYGAPSSHIFRAEHAVLIAAGIGVTPFASILQSIMHRYYADRQICPCCNSSWASRMPDSIMNLKKVDFFWINRDQRSFEWFVHLLSQLEMEQAEMGGVLERFLDLHMYITSALAKTDIKAIGLQMALDLLHAKEKRDLLTGLKTRTHSGRPNWDKAFQQLLDKDCGKITVFYCGPPQLAKVLKKKCNKFGFEFRKEIF